jgi:predicted acyltransferase
MGSITHHPFWEGLSAQFEHPVWNGFTAYDLIFPLFIFLSGVSTPYAIGSAIAAGKSKNALLWKVIKRGMILVLLGIIYNNGLQLRPISDIRFMSVLGLELLPCWEASFTSTRKKEPRSSGSQRCLSDTGC